MIKLPYNAPEGFDWIITLTDWQINKNVITIKAESARAKPYYIKVTVLNQYCWNYAFGDERILKEVRNPFGIIPVNDEQESITITEDSKALKVRCGKVIMIVQKNPWSVQFMKEKKDLLLKENQSDIDGLGRLFIMPLGVIIDGGITAVTQSYYLDHDEHIYGFGEKFTPLDKRSQKITSWNMDAFGSTSERSHKNIPFYLSSKGYGLFLNSSARIKWDVGNDSCQSLSIAAEDDRLDSYLFFGESPENILKEYALLTGKPELPPKWSFGLWVSSGGTYRDKEAMEKLLDGLEEHSIPADVVHIDPWWMHWRMYCDFRWNSDAFPDAERFIGEIHKRGLRICLWEQPYVSIESELFAYGCENGYFAKKPDGEVYVIDYGLSLAPRPDGIIRKAEEAESWNAPVAVIDFTNPDAVAWFKDLHRHVLKMGNDVMKTDFGEDIPEDAVFFDGSTGKRMHNAYPLLYNKAVSDVTFEEKGHRLVWARSGTAGSQKYPVCWSADPAADFPSLAGTIRGGLSAALSGIPFWSNDIGGYRGMPGDELYIRWAQFGLLCSHSRMHGDSPREPWFFKPETLEIVKKMIELRYSLFPYIYDTAKEAVEGIPFLRPLFLEFPDDHITYKIEDDFMIGNSLLAAPVCSEDNKVNLYFPDGKWADWYDGSIINGTTAVTTNVPIDRIPLFIRQNAVIPLMEGEMRIPENGIAKLRFLIFPVSKTSYEYRDELGKVNIRFSVDEDEISFLLQSEKERAIALSLILEESIHYEFCENDVHLHIGKDIEKNGKGYYTTPSQSRKLSRITITKKGKIV